MSQFKKIEAINKKERAIKDAISKMTPVSTKEGVDLIEKTFLQHIH